MLPGLDIGSAQYFVKSSVFWYIKGMSYRSIAATTPKVNIPLELCIILFRPILSPVILFILFIAFRKKGNARGISKRSRSNTVTAF